jgi:hypothetical protein
MTEAEWLELTDARQMLSAMGNSVSQRKLRLFACACYRHIWDTLDNTQQGAVAVAQRYADGLVPDSERDAAMTAVYALDPEAYDYATMPGAFPSAVNACYGGLYQPCFNSPARSFSAASHPA